MASEQALANEVTAKAVAGVTRTAKQTMTAATVKRTQSIA